LSAPLVVKNGTKIFCLSASDIPIPLSVMTSSTPRLL